MGVVAEFNYDYNVSISEAQQRGSRVEYNFRTFEPSESLEDAPDDDIPALMAVATGTDRASYLRQRPGVSAFALEDGVICHAYSGYARSLDGLWGMYQWLDRAPRGRNETGWWWKRHDEY